MEQRKQMKVESEYYLKENSIEDKGGHSITLQHIVIEYHLIDDVIISRDKTKIMCYLERLVRHH